MKYVIYLNIAECEKRFCKDRLCEAVWIHCGADCASADISGDSPLSVMLTCRLLKKVFGWEYEKLSDAEKGPYLIDRDTGVQRYSFGQALFLWAGVQFRPNQMNYFFSVDDIDGYGVRFIPSDHRTIMEIESGKECSPLLEKIMDMGGITGYQPLDSEDNEKESA